ncbi:MAG TPA: flagellar basal-body rod protein FlgF [Dongiaceae bacterium]|nr:flagellar basal-body rod protein FlgF [Dongiaceae bacterium]
MNTGFYSAFSGFAARMDALDVLANNLANTNTTGFKSQKEFYRSFFASLANEQPVPQPATVTAALNNALHQFGGLAGSQLDLSQGTLESTGNDTDLAIEGKGFFAVLTANGVRYTRNGSLHLDTQRQLVTEQGDPVLSQQPAGRNEPIRVPSGKVTVSSDGSITVDGGLVAKLRVDDFPPSTALAPEGASYFVAPAGAKATASSASLRQGMLESSNSDPVHSTVALIDLQRTAQMMEKALSIFHNEFNRSAAQDLPRVQ